MFLREDQSWEDTQLKTIAKDHNLLNSFQIMKYINVALLTVLLYDYCLTFNLEKRRIWTLQWKLPKYLFMFNRYILPPIFCLDAFCNIKNVGNKICDMMMILATFPTSAAILTVELMLMLRVLALYGNSPRLARFLVIQSLIQMIASGFLGCFLIAKTRIIVGHNVFTGCLYDLPKWSNLAWTPLFIAETSLVVITVYKCRDYGGFSPVVKILARDSVIYFICIFCLTALNMFYSHEHQLLSMALSFPTTILTSIAATRLSMNIRAATVERGIATLAYQSSLPTLLSFARNTHNHNSADATSVDPTGFSEEGGEPEGVYYDDDDDDDEGWREERNQDSEAIIQEDRCISTTVGDVERATRS